MKFVEVGQVVQPCISDLGHCFLKLDTLGGREGQVVVGIEHKGYIINYAGS